MIILNLSIYPHACIGRTRTADEDELISGWKQNIPSSFIVLVSIYESLCVIRKILRMESFE